MRREEREAAGEMRAVTLRTRVADALREAILSGELRPGERLREVDLAARFGVSRNPVREAIGELEQQGLIVSRPNQGKEVVSPDREALAQALQVRVSLELLALRLAWPRLAGEHLGELRRLADEMGRLAADTSLPALHRHGRLNILDDRFHSRLIQWSANATLERAWFAASPSSFGFIQDLQGTEEDAGGSDVDLHAGLVDALEAALAADDNSAAERAWEAHFHRRR